MATLSRRAAGRSQPKAHGAMRSTTPLGPDRPTRPGAAAGASWRAFSDNPDKAWAEKWFLAYSPIWPALFAAWSISGWHLHAGDVGNMGVTVLIALPNLVVPALYCPTPGPWHQTYWFKFSLWIAVFSFIASYFFTEYFFDVLKMKYHFPHLRWNLDAVLVGSGRQVVPLMMYVHAWYFFMTYHCCSVIFIRLIRTSPLARAAPRIAQVFAVAFSAWLFAWGEIYGTTMEAIRDQFEYGDMDWALRWGALCYACYFMASFPLVYEMDESAASPKWGVRKSVENALAASMIAFLLLDLVCQFVITGWNEVK